MTNASTHLPYLDGWRGLAIAALLAGHFFPVAGINLGGLGVNLFFVLSGLLMGRLLFVDTVPIQAFYRRRIARIFPLAYLFLAAVACSMLPGGAPAAWHELGAAAAFLNNYLWTDDPVLPIGHFWSLCVEEHAYVVLALVALGARSGRFGARTAIGLALACMAGFGACYSFGYDGPDLYHQRWLHSEVSGFGIFVSAFLLLQLRGWRGTVHWSVVAALAGAGLALHWWRVEPFWRTFAGVTALAAAINLLDRAPGPMHAGLALAPLQRLGVWSFSIYVWQQPFYMAVEAGELPAWAGVACALAAGAASFYLLEQPARRWLNEKWRSPADGVRHLAVPAPAGQPGSPL